MRKWTEKEYEYLEQNFQLINYRDIAKALNRSYDAIRKKLSILGLRLSKDELNKRRVISAKKNLHSKSIVGSNNPNWKNGISKNNYHYKKIQKTRYPKRVKARELVYKAVKNGKLIRKPCKVCGENVSEAHHENYDKPLEVIWLCKKHHRQRHNVLDKLKGS